MQVTIRVDGFVAILLAPLASSQSMFLKSREAKFASMACVQLGTIYSTLTYMQKCKTTKSSHEMVQPFGPVIYSVIIRPPVVEKIGFLANAHHPIDLHAESAPVHRSNRSLIEIANNP